jgi:NAD(P)H dehydrogenase (quinone)
VLSLSLRVEETLSPEALQKMYAPGQDKSIPFITPDKLAEYDGFLLGIPTRYGNFPAQWKTFWDKTGGHWSKGTYSGKYAGLFVSSGTLGGGQESTCIAAMSTLAHHGIIYVPLGYKHATQHLMNVEEVRGGGPFGAGTFAVRTPTKSSNPSFLLICSQGPAGARQPSPAELEVATIQGKAFYETLKRVNFE